MKRINLYFTGMAVVAVLTIAGVAKSQSNAAPAWEYKVVSLDGGVNKEAELNKYGAAGWELVTNHIQLSTGAYGRPTSPINTYEWKVVLKRRAVN